MDSQTTYEQISRMIMKYIEPQESIILNVLSATVDFTTCESIRMSRQVDQTGERTLAVVTKADKAPEGLLQKVTSNDASIGLGYVRVRNCIGDETYQKARVEEEKLFRTHPLLSMIDDDIVGIPVLAHKLIQIQATMITRCLPEIERKINERMEFSVLELNKLPVIMASTGEALMALMCWLTKLFPRSAFWAILSQYVDAIHTKPVEFIKDIWDYIEAVLSSVITKYSENFPQIQSSIKRAGRNLICKMKEQSLSRVTEIVEMEKMTDYTCNPEYMTSWSQKTSTQQTFIQCVSNQEYFSLNGSGTIKISHLRKYHTLLLQQAFDMKMRITSYWTIVLRRIVDNLALHLQFSVKNLVNKEFHKEMVAEMVDTKSGSGGGVKRLLEESPSVASKREKLNNSVKLLKESKDTVAAILDQISGYGDH